MKFYRLVYIAASVLAVLSCKKDDDATVTPGLSGSMQILNLPEFISPEQTCTMKPKGAIHPEGGELGYYWKVTPTMSKYDTTRYTNGLDTPDATGKPSDGSFTHTFSDTLKTYTVYCYAYAEGYSGISAVSYTTVVKGGPDGSIEGLSFPSESVATADGTYYYKTIGTQTWTVNNISEKASGKAFRNAEVMSDVFGRYYDYEEAVAVCESLPGNEWRLPTEDDWNTLEQYIKENVTNDGKTYGKSVASALMGKATFNGIEMWEYWPNVGDITNSTGFSALSTGYANLQSRAFEGTYEYSMFWTASEDPENKELAYYKYLICDQPDIYTGKADKKSFGASVRCIKK